VNGTIVHINATLLNWLNASEDEVIHQDFTDLLDKGGKLYYQLFVQPLLSMNDEVTEISFHVATDKCNFHCFFSATAFKKDEDGEMLFNASVYRVIDRKKYEAELLKKKKQADVEKEIKNVILKEVAFDQSHLVRAPLANILGLTSLLEDMDISGEAKDMIYLLRTSATNLDHAIVKLADKIKTT
jgi:hypothetical protein